MSDLEDRSKATGSSETQAETDAKPGNPLRVVLGVAVLFLLGLLTTAGVKSYRDLVEVRAHKVNLEQQIQATETRLEALRDHAERIETDPATLERLAREELGMVLPGDVVIILPDDGVPAFPTSPES